MRRCCRPTPGSPIPSCGSSRTAARGCRRAPAGGGDGHVVPIDVPVGLTCPHCGGRGETWTEPCLPCFGSGDALFHHPVRVSVPPGVANGACFRFRLSSRDALPLRVELHVAVRSAAM